MSGEEGVVSRVAAEVKAEELIRLEQWEEALKVHRQLADEGHEEPDRGRLQQLLQRLELDVPKLLEENSGGSHWLLGEWKTHVGSSHQAYAHFEKSAEKGHAVGLYRMGYHKRNGIGCDSNVKEGMEAMQRAWQLGCSAATLSVAICYLHKADSKRQAAIWLLKAARAGHREALDPLKKLQESNPLGSVPLGLWEPSVHALVADEIHQAMRTTMLLCAREQLPRDVSLLIASYVCTGWQEWLLLLRRMRSV